MSGRKQGPVGHEANRAIMSMAGIGILVQSSLTVAATTEQTYTVTHPNTRRVCLIHAGAGAFDMRVNIDASADNTKLPILPQRYFVIDAGWQEDGDAQVVHVYNTSGTQIVVYLAEME